MSTTINGPMCMTKTGPASRVRAGSHLGGAASGRSRGPAAAALAAGSRLSACLLTALLSTLAFGQSALRWDESAGGAAQPNAAAATYGTVAGGGGRMLVAQPQIAEVRLREEENKKEHWTADFKDDFALRRGQTFVIDLRLSHGFDKLTHTLPLTAEVIIDGFGTDRLTTATINIPARGAAGEAGEWWAQLVSTTEAGQDTLARLKVNVPADAPVGLYQFKARVAPARGGADLSESAFPKKVALLFNPWASADQVFLSEQRERKEYVLETAGLMDDATGLVAPNAWIYDQFDTVTLKGVMQLLNGLTAEQRQSATTVSRRLSGRIRWTADRTGNVIEGRWSGDYTGGTKPEEWKSSKEIFKKFVETGPRVKYAQCWVFGGLLTSSLRCLGVPARPLTNARSAVDANGDDLVRHHVAPDTYPDGDSEWNYHVWCDAWMKRPDQRNRDGWQAVDPTYFERGPAAVSAIKARAGGDYEVQKYTAAVSAVYVKLRQEGGRLVETGREANRFGGKILTKKIGADAFVSIRGLYRPGAAATDGPDDDEADELPALEEIEDTLSFPGLEVVLAVPARTPLGHDFVASATVYNTGSMPRSLTLTLRGEAVAYSSDWLGDLRSESFSLELEPGAVQAVSFSMTVDEYLAWMESTQWLRVAGQVVDTDTGEADFVSVTAPLTLPELTVTVSPAGRVAAGTPVDVTCTFTNSLPYALNNVRVRAITHGGVNFADDATETVMEIPVLMPDARLQVTQQIVPGAAGRPIVLYTLMADQHPVVSGFERLWVRDALLGDVNCDGVVNFDDIDAFVLALIDVDAFEQSHPSCDADRADINGDGEVNFVDIDAFIGCLFGAC